MSIKGTLETFNLCELLQMLAFNQKEGTLILEAEGGARTLFLDSGKLAFLEQDGAFGETVLRLARRRKLSDEASLQRAVERWEESGHNLLSCLESGGLVDAETAAGLRKEAALEQLFEAQLTSVAAFEFVEGEVLRPDGSPGVAMQPMLGVEGLLLDLARMLDHWNSVSELIAGPSEVYEGTGIAVDLDDDEETDPDLADMVVPLIDGYRSLEQIGEACYATPYAVTLVAAALVQGGGIRPVPTEDLLARAEEQLAHGDPDRALPLLRRCIERGDGPLEVRLRLADALEASGDPGGAAAELDTFAALSGDEDAVGVFEALSRALRLREGEFATAARVCDYYLRRRPWLQDYRSVAAEALRNLIHGATTGGRPIDAALRLKGFIEAGDAPSEDLLLLADLFAAAGARKEAGAALYARCEELVATDRTTAARQMLRRVLEFDPGHADAHRRQSELEGARRRRGHRTRIVAILLLIGGVGAAAGLAWRTYRDTSSTEITLAHEQAQDAVARAEEKADALIAAFAARAERAAQEGDPDLSLGQAATELLAQVQATMSATADALAAYGDEIKRSEAAGYGASHESTYEALAQRKHLVTSRAKQLVDEQARNARAALVAAQRAHKDGEFEEARSRLRIARNLAFDDATTRTDTDRMLGLVEEYFTRYEAVRAEMLAATKRGDLRGAFDLGLSGIEELLDSDLTRKLPFPVQVSSEPAGAEVWIGRTNTGERTPCLLTYSPFAEEPVLRLRLPGRTGVVARLPSYEQIRHGDAVIASWNPRISGRLEPGPRWTVGDPVGSFSALWGGGEVPLVAGAGGRVVYAASPIDGRLAPGARVGSTQDPIRLGGRLAGGIEWHVRGHRTLSVHPPATPAWEIPAIGRVERAPVCVQERLMLVDELGTLYCYRAHSGDALWRAELGGPPTQRPYASKLGLLVATTMGATYRIDVETGLVQPLAPSIGRPSFALPFGDGALLVGGGVGGCRRVDADGKVEALGNAQPDMDRPPWVDETGIAWIASDGVHWLAAGASAPVHVPALGRDVERIGGGDGRLFAAARDGTLRAVDLTKPDRLLWSAPMGGRAQCPPLPLGHVVYVLVGGRLVAFEV